MRTKGDSRTKAAKISYSAERGKGKGLPKLAVVMQCGMSMLEKWRLRKTRALPDGYKALRWVTYVSFSYCCALFCSVCGNEIREIHHYCTFHLPFRNGRGCATGGLLSSASAHM